MLSVARRDTEITLQRIEEVLIAFKDSVVSVWFSCAQKRIVSSCSLKVSEDGLSSLRTLLCGVS